MKANETWKPVRSGKYEVSDLGRVRFARTGRVLKPYTDKLQEYYRVDIYENGKRAKAMVHTLVAEAFIGPKPKDREIDHINTNIHDNSVGNLRYVTKQENANNPITRFNLEVSRIRKAILTGKKTPDDISRIVRVLKVI